MAAELSELLGRTIPYVDEPFDPWRERELIGRNLPDHLRNHLETMAKLHAANRYDRLKPDVNKILGRPSTSIRDHVAKHRELFAQGLSTRKVFQTERS